jgi:hypothetical protein
MSAQDPKRSRGRYRNCSGGNSLGKLVAYSGEGLPPPFKITLVPQIVTSIFMSEMFIAFDPFKTIHELLL